MISKSELFIELVPSYKVTTVKSTASIIEQTLELRQLNALQEHF